MSVDKYHTLLPLGLEINRGRIYVGHKRPFGQKLVTVIITFEYSPNLSEAARAENLANAEFIVRACNSHYELLEKGKALCAELVDFRNRDGVPHNAMANAAFQEFKAAIAKAGDNQKPKTLNEQTQEILQQIKDGK